MKNDVASPSFEPHDAQFQCSIPTRDIVAGQELLIDYKESYWKERAVMERYMGPFRAAHQPEELDRLRAALVQRRGE